MDKAYRDFAKKIAELEKRGSALVKKNLKKIETEKIEDVLDEIKNS